jgi:hypothetical protein
MSLSNWLHYLQMVVMLTVIPDQDVICFGVSDPVAVGALAQVDGVRHPLSFLDIRLVHLVGWW